MGRWAWGRTEIPRIVAGGQPRSWAPQLSSFARLDSRGGCPYAAPTRLSLAYRCAQQMKIPSRLLYIPGNLFAQRIDGRELDLIPQSLQKTDLHFRVRRQFDGMEVQQVRLNGEQLGPEGRTIPYVGHRIKALRCHARPRDVNAVFGYELFVTRQVNGWDGVLRSVPAASSRHTQDAKRTRQQMSRAAHAPGRNQLANLRAGNGFAAEPHLGTE